MEDDFDISKCLVKGKTSVKTMREVDAREITFGGKSGDGSVRFSWTSDSDQFDGC